MKITKKNLTKILSILCCVALILSAFFSSNAITFALTSGSDDSIIGKDELFKTTTVYGFEPSEDPVSNGSVAPDSPNMTRGDDGMGVMGWTYDISDGDEAHGKVLHTHNDNMTQAWPTSGGYRINNSDGVYRLEKNTTYYIELDINLTSAHSIISSDGNTTESNVYLGYGSWDNTSNSNGVDLMANKLFNIINVKKDATQYTVTSSEGAVKYDVNSGWHTAKFVFTTPANFGSADNALALYSVLLPGARIQIDNVSVKALDDDEGVVVFVDDFHGNTTILLDDINKEVELPVITPQNPEHAFEGWYSSYDRTDNTKVEAGYKMVSGITTLYARFNAPVSLTFVNTLTNTSDVIVGMPGAKINYPANPTDSAKWFGGWYTNENYTKLYTSENFAYTNIILYSKWIDPIPSSSENFETYTKHIWSEKIVSASTMDAEGKEIKDKDGNPVKVDAKYKDNYQYFGRMCHLVDNIAYGDSDYSIKYTWDAEMMLDPNDPETYYAVTRHDDPDSAVILEDVQLSNDTKYIVTFKYFIEDISDNLTVTFASARNDNIWGNNKLYTETGNVFTITPGENDGQWHEGKVAITTSFANNESKSMYFIVRMSQNKDAVIYLDDFVFTPIKPTETYSVYNCGNENHIYIGNIGSALPHTVANPDKILTSYKWHSDLTFSSPFTATVFTEKPVVAYAMAPITFKYDYPYITEPGNAFGKSMAIVKEKGVGNGDDYALKLIYDGDKYLRKNPTTGKDEYWRDRYNNPDWQAAVKTGLKNNTVYIVTYDVKSKNASLDYNVEFATAAPNNVWGNLVKVSKEKVSASTNKDWETHTIAIKTGDNLSYANALWMFVTFAHSLEGQYAEVYIDNILVREAKAPMAVFASNSDTGNVIVSGNAGSTIKYPAAPIKFGYIFNGWYTDKECTQPFTATTFSADEIFYAYAGYTVAKTKVFDYEDYYVPYSIPVTGPYMRHDCEVIEVPFAYSGTHVMKFDRSFIRNPDLNTGGSGHLIKQGSTVQKLSKDKNYIITFKYYIETQGQQPLRVRAHAGSNINFWGSSQISNTYYIPLDKKIGVWHTGTLVCSGAKIAEGYQDHLYLSTNIGTEGMYYFDDITVTELEEGQMAYFVDNSGCSNIPEYVIGRPGESFASQLPKNPKYTDHQFLGYFVMGSDGKYEKFTDMKFYTDKEPSIVARFIKLKIVQDFETYYALAIAAMPGYSVHDYDYELYDALANGNSRDNTTSGRYSLHRMGKSQYFENALLLTQAQQLTAGEKYTVTFKVKMPSYLQTDGAIKLVCGNSGIFSWATMGDYYPVVAVKDLADGQWHEVSYTFIALEPYMVIQTPGYCELFIDDVVFKHVSQDTPVSEPVTFTEYIPMKRDLTTGEIIDAGANKDSIDISTIVDESLGSKLSDGFIRFITSGSTLSLIVIVAAALIIIALIVILVLVLLKKKNKKA